MCQERIDEALEDVHFFDEDETDAAANFRKVVNKCREIRDSAWFSLFITCMIILVSIMIGIDADKDIHCTRFLLFPP